MRAVGGQGRSEEKELWKGLESLGGFRKPPKTGMKNSTFQNRKDIAILEMRRPKEGQWGPMGVGQGREGKRRRENVNGLEMGRK